ncbi:MAG: tRNA (5-methylaminomethyl-2-thiouridylate)-methyltransferase [Candidatus Nitrotoga sp. SPKER]|nr:MAG: tRNA (5-methylaminomethyl-2-thiouridylate)-methyltransferase [Candidatus Nitrotoga sp. SPKER]
MTKGCIIVGISGGVDSAVTALLLKQQGYKVIGLFMKNWEDDDSDEYCSSRQDLIDAVSIADTIGIPIETVNFAKEYKERVFNHFLREYAAGHTPNPDILCNSEIKFKAFLEHAVNMGADSIATGHYAQIRRIDGNYQLLKAIDSSKDQSYFLYRLNQMQLSKTMFPLGTLLKSQVREIARQHNLSNYAKKDSTGICFIGERPFREFLNRYLPTQPGPIYTIDGQMVGKHMGLSFYTIGQRQGLGIGGQGLPWFVSAKNIANNHLIVVQGHDHPALLSTSLDATEMHWINHHIPDITRDYTAKIRYRQADVNCHFDTISDSFNSFKFSQVQWAVTPGQSIVIYDGEICLGGGIITNNR